MVRYEGIDSDIVIYPPQTVEHPLGEVIANAGLKQLRIAETEKYAHVTFFLDGGKELDYKNEKKILVPSPKVATYDLKPQMSATEVTANLLDEMPNFDFFVCNYANPDMVGHTGNFEATKLAVETVDACLQQVLVTAKEKGYTLFITSDHGNCDKMLDENGRPCTTHSSAPVFFICTDESIRLKDGALNNIAPTILKYLGIDKPKEMDKKPLY
ncbi:MAG: alkaline phosphatase family protein [Mycoplasmoidaceae bacterium]|nr:alkaline phosphatase family protein [Mycoplasmoidaceae bacterium]